MSKKSDIIAALPPFRDEMTLIVQTQGTADIKREIFRVHGKFEDDYNLIYKFFDSNDLSDTCRQLWSFLKHNFNYYAEKKAVQSVRSPSSIVNSKSLDCKNYSLWSGGILEALIVNTSKPGWDWFYRFASDKSTRHVTHVFVVACDGQNEYWIDPCLASFNERKDYLLIEDWVPNMALYEINGVTHENTGRPVIIDVSKQLAWRSFLPLVDMDFLSLKEIMKNAPGVVDGPFRNYCLANGFDFNQFKVFLYGQ